MIPLIILLLLIAIIALLPIEHRAKTICYILVLVAAIVWVWKNGVKIG